MMQFQLTNCSLFCSFLLFIFIVLRSHRRSKSLPGPWKLPLIGHLHHLSSLPHHALRDIAKKHGPVLLLRFGEVDTLVVSSPSAAKEVLKTQDLLFVNRPKFLAADIISYNYKNISLSPYNDYWKQCRKICGMELLSPMKVKSMWSIREEEVANLIEEISLMAMSRSNVNLSESVVSLVSGIFSRAAFGKKYKDREAFVLLMEEAMSYAGGFEIADLFPSLTYLHFLSGTKTKLLKIQPKIDKILDNVIQEHIQKRTRTDDSGSEHDEEDIVDIFLRLREESRLEIPVKNDEIKAVMMDLYAAGSDTSSTTIVWAMAELIRNPKVMAKAQEEVRRVFNGKTKISHSDINELSYLRLVIQETLRLHPILPLLVPRETREKCVVEGCEIPKGTKVMVNAWALSRDPDFWSNADMFEPERFENLSIAYNGSNFSYLPFGSGRRICPGMSYGMANIEFILSQLIYHFDWKIFDGVNPDELDMTEAFGMTLSKKLPLNLLPQPLTYHKKDNNIFFTRIPQNGA